MTANNEVTPTCVNGTVLAYIFPGQGTQHLGMGKSVLDTSSATKKIWDCASDTADFDVRKLCTRGPMSRLSATAFQQVAVTTVNLATLAALREAEHPAAKAMLGHSVGEYSALYASGVLGLEDTLKAVAARGRIMQAMAERTKGAMYAIKGVDHAQVQALLERTPDAADVTVANDNTPAQQVISGSRSGIQAVLREALRQQLSSVRLPVNGAWHSSLMADGQAEFTAVLDELEFHPPTVPVFMNVAAAAVSDPQTIKSNLVSHLTSTVRWRETILALSALGIRDFLEIGPRRVLTHMLRDFPAPELSARHAEDILAERDSSGQGLQISSREA